MAFELIKLDIADKIATITLNNADRLNAMSPAMATEVSNALGQIGDARAVVITGEGRAFCSGADLASKGDGDSIQGGEGSYRALTRNYNPLMAQLAKLPVPVITAVNGPAAGVGCSVALAADFAIAGKSAYFLQAFVNIGLVPDGGASWMLPRLVGKARATEMMLLGEKIPGEKAADWGMIYKCVEDDALMDEAMALAKRLANGPTVAIGLMRQNIASALEADYGSALLREAESQKIAGDTEDSRSAMIAFLKKEKAVFKGK